MNKCKSFSSVLKLNFGAEPAHYLQMDIHHALGVRVDIRYSVRIHHTHPHVQHFKVCSHGRSKQYLPIASILARDSQLQVPQKDLVLYAVAECPSEKSIN